MRSTDRLGITVSVVVLGLLVSTFVPLPSQGLVLVLFGSELALRLSGAVQVALILVPLVCAGVDSVMRAHPRSQPPAHRVALWMLPTLVVIVSFVVLGHLAWWGHGLAFIGLTGLVLAVVMVLQRRTATPGDESNRVARVGLNAVAFAVGLILFVTLYGSRLRSILSTVGVLLVSGMLALELLRTVRRTTGYTWLYVGLTGVLMGELAWALSYCSLEPAIGGGFLLLAFYTLTGLMQQHLRGRLSKRVIVEFGAVCAIGLVLLTSIAGGLSPSTG